MKLLIDHHHYKKELISSEDKAAVYERYVIDLLLASKVSDSQRESSIAFELKHHHSVAQLTRILAKQRGLQEDVCVVGALLHDINVVINGTYKDHAHKSAVIAASILDEIGLFSEEEKGNIIKIVYHHSDKDVWSDDPYEEICKDSDTLDSFLYPNAFGYYLKHKKLSVFECYIERAKRIWKELNIPLPMDYSILDNYSESWLCESICCNYDKSLILLVLLSYIIDEKKDILVPVFCISQKGKNFIFSFNDKSLQKFSLAFEDKYSSQLNMTDINLPINIFVSRHI